MMKYSFLLLSAIYRLLIIICVDYSKHFHTHGIVNKENDYNIPSYERQALYDLYNSTNGIDWIYQEGENGHWDFTDPEVNPCLASNPWQGLNCTHPLISESSSTYYYISEILLSDYNLNGYIPDSIGNFSYLQYLDLSYNYINMRIPNTIGNLSKLVELDLSYNSLSGSLPSSIYELSTLQVLNLDSNYHLQGTISDLIGKLSQLQYLNLKSNSFGGNIPSTVGNLSETLTYLRLTANQLTGTIPNSIKELKYLYLLYLSINQLTGIVPDWIGNLSSLTHLSIGGNLLSGTIPDSLSNLRQLNILSLSANQLTGTIPNSIGELSLLTYLGLHTNQLMGTIPSSLSYLFHLENLYLHDNLLKNSIPNDIFNKLTQLTDLKIYNNYLTGTLPDSISKLQYLQYFYVQNNHFKGNLDKNFNGSYQKQLSDIQLSNNQFTGALPEQVFLSHSLTAFSAVSNCFHGSIPSSICNNTDLVSLALDGLVCATSCQYKIIPGISSAYMSENEITGGIPECLWSMPNLQVLHLSGNSMTGSLPDNINPSSTLIDLSLSYNILTGKIPKLMQERAWGNLDLSHNRISGTLTSKYASQSINASLSLKDNRLSGSIPNHLKDMRNISILEGNYYNCKYDHSDLPTHDDHRDSYACGSNAFEVLYYIWLGSVFSICSVMILAWYNQNRIDKYLQISNLAQNIWKWIYILEYLKVHSETIPEKFIYFKAYNAIHEIISRFTLNSTLSIIIIILPVYFVLSIYYSTHTYVYALKVSILYLSGSIAFGIIISILLLFIILLLFTFYYNIQSNLYRQVLVDISEQQHFYRVLSIEIANKLSGRHQRWRIYSMYVIYIAINIIVVGGANVAYVYAVLYQRNEIIILSQFLLSIFKMVWNNIISSKMVYWIINYLSIQQKNNKIIHRRFFILQFMVSIFNNIIVPCFIVAIISPNCFFHIFQEPETSGTFTYQGCILFAQNGDTCLEYETFESSARYTTPFLYSYQCSSDFVTYYAPVFVLMGFISTFIVPIINYFIWRLSQYYNFISVLHELPKILHLNSNVVPPLLAIDHIYEFLVSILTMVGLILTFGVAFPPLAVVFLLAIYRRIYYHKAIIGRYISQKMELNAYICLDIIEEDCKVIPLLSTLQQCAWILLSVSCIFYTLFVFDILGDEVGLYQAYWVLIIMPCIPICIYTIYRIYKHWLDINTEHISNNHNNKADHSPSTTSDTFHIDNNTSIDKDIELSTRVATIPNPLFLDSNINIAIDNNDRDRIISIDDIYVEDREGNSIYYPNDCNLMKDDV